MDIFKKSPILTRWLIFRSASRLYSLISRLMVAVILAASVSSQAADSVPSFLDGSSEDTSRVSAGAPGLERFQAQGWYDDNKLYIGLMIPDGTYLYRDKIDVTSDQTAGLWMPVGDAHKDEFFGDVRIFRDQTLVATALPTGAGSEASIDVDVTFQACADVGLCYPPESRTIAAYFQPEAPTMFASDVQQVPARITPKQIAVSGATPGDSGYMERLHEGSLPLLLATFFLAGLALTFTPCVLPMLPIISALIVSQAHSKPKALALSSSYAFGMASAYASIGFLTGFFGASINLQAKLQSPLLLTFFAIIFCLLGAAMMGFLSIKLPTGITARIHVWQDKAQRGGALGMVAAGALSVFVVSPCVTAPLAGALMFVSSTGNAGIGGGALFAMGVGMGVPLILVGTFGATLLPKSGQWMNSIKIAMGSMLVGVALLLLSRFIPAYVIVLASSLLIAGAVLMILRDLDKPNSRLAGLLCWPFAWIAMAFLVTGTPPSLSNLLSGQYEALPFTNEHKSAVTTVTSLDALSKETLGAAQGESVLVGFTADWCSSCKVMDKRLEAMKASGHLAGIKRVNVDITEYTDEAAALMDAYGIFGPPVLMMLINGEEVSEQRIQGVVPQATLEAWLTKAKAL